VQLELSFVLLHGANGRNLAGKSADRQKALIPPGFQQKSRSASHGTAFFSQGVTTA